MTDHVLHRASDRAPKNAPFHFFSRNEPVMNQSLSLVSAHWSESDAKNGEDASTMPTENAYSGALSIGKLGTKSECKFIEQNKNRAKNLNRNL